MVRRSLRFALLCCASAGASIAPLAAAAAEWELSFYLGTQSAPHSDVDGEIRDGTGALVPFSQGVEWEGDSFTDPLYYGLRLTRWSNEVSGWAFEFNHAKVYASDEDLEDLGFSSLELTDGINIITINYMRRFPDMFDRLLPYVGAGAGVSVPHVDVSNGVSDTFEYQLTGPAVVWIAGASYPFNDTWAGFVEYKGTYSQNDADLDDGGSLETDIITNALNFGVTYSF